MQSYVFSLATLFVLSSTGLAQIVGPVGFNFNVAPGATSRSGINTAAELMTRIDFDDYRGLDETVEGFQVIMQDQDVATTPGELFDFFMYDEDPLMPEFPNIPGGSAPGTNAIVSLLGLAGPAAPSPGSATVGAAILSVTLTTPANIGPISSDLFMSFSVPAAPAWPSDGVSVQINLGINPMFPAPAPNIYDVPGSAPIAQTSYGVVHDVVGGGFSYGGPRQLMADLLSSDPSGVVTAITAQTNYPLSNAAPGTASFFSGLHPEASPGRGDNIGYVYFDSSLSPGSPVFFLGDFDFFQFPLALSAFVPGAVGWACVPQSAQVLSLQIAAGPQVENVITIPTAFRSLITGQNFVFDAVAFDAVTGQIRGGYCGKQHF